jgi:hypothetical protein
MISYCCGLGRRRYVLNELMKCSVKFRVSLNRNARDQLGTSDSNRNSRLV